MNDLTVEQKNIILNGSDKIKIPYGKHTLESRMRWSGITAKPREEGYYKGILPVMNDILQRIDEDLRQGAVGVGVTSAYMNRGLSSYEQFAVQRAAARYGRLASVHTRYHLNTQTPTEAPIGVDEVLANAMLLNAPLIIAHDNDYGWWEIEEKLQLARAKGLNMWSEYQAPKPRSPKSTSPERTPAMAMPTESHSCREAESRT